MVGTVDPAEPSEAEEVINPITQFAFNGVLVTRVEGVSVADANADEADPAQDPTARHHADHRAVDP